MSPTSVNFMTQAMMVPQMTSDLKMKLQMGPHSFIPSMQPNNMMAALNHEILQNMAMNNGQLATAAVAPQHATLQSNLFDEWISGDAFSNDQSEYLQVMGGMGKEAAQFSMFDQTKDVDFNRPQFINRRHQRSDSISSIASYASDASLSSSTGMPSMSSSPQITSTSESELDLNHMEALFLDDPLSSSVGILDFSDAALQINPRRRSTISHQRNNTVDAASGDFTMGHRRKMSAPAALDFMTGLNGMMPLMEANEKIFTCTVDNCGRVFKRYEHMKRHMRGHTGEK